VVIGERALGQQGTTEGQFMEGTHEVGCAAVPDARDAVLQRKEESRVKRLSFGRGRRLGRRQHAILYDKGTD